MRCCAYWLLLFTFMLSHTHGQETFQFQLGGPQPGTWESAANWTGGSGLYSTWPGQAPQVGTLDSANLAAARSTNYSINIGTPGLSLDTLTLGSSSHQVVTTITGSPGATLTANQIRSANSGVSPHLINIDFVMPTGGLSLPDTGVLAPLSFNGKFLNTAPVPSTYRIVDNQSRRVLNVNGTVTLSDTATAGNLLFRNGGLPAFTVINGVIEDGAAAGGGVSYVRGRFVVTNANTYSGETVIGANSPNTETQVEIHHDLAFGTGRVTAGGGDEERTLIAIGGTRTLANEIRLARDMQFTGSNSFVLNGQVFQSNTRNMINDLPTNRTLTINGDIYTADDNTARPWTFTGTGRTIVNGSINNSLTSPTAFGRLVKSGAGTLELHGDSFYAGGTNVNAGVLVVDNDTGSATGSGNVSVNSNATLRGRGSIAGVVTVNSGAKLELGSPLGDLQVGGLSLLAGGTLSFDVAGDGGVAGVDFDQLAVNGAASLAGTLNIALSGSFDLTGSDSFTILSATSLTGAFQNVVAGERLTTIDGIGSFIVNYGSDTNSVVLSDFESTLAADFDRDGDVDADDLSRWQENYGINELADADRDGDSDGQDFLIWQNQVGSSVLFALATQTVPEPAGLTLCLVVTMCGSLIRQFRA